MAIIAYKQKTAKQAKIEKKVLFDQSRPVKNSFTTFPNYHLTPYSWVHLD